MGEKCLFDQNTETRNLRFWQKTFLKKLKGIPEFLDSGRKCWTLDSGRWTLDVGCYTLDTIVDCFETKSEASF